MMYIIIVTRDFDRPLSGPLKRISSILVPSAAAGGPSALRFLSPSPRHRSTETNISFSHSLTGRVIFSRTHLYINVDDLLSFDTNYNFRRTSNNSPAARRTHKQRRNINGHD